MSTVFLVRLDDEKGIMQSHRLFSARQLAEDYIEDEPLPIGHKFRIIEREAVPQVVARLQTHKQ